MNTESINTPLSLQPLTAEAFAPYGWMLGRPFPDSGQSPAFSNPATDFYQEHVFDTGAGGETEILWVNYRSTDLCVSALEKHVLTQQAIVPLSGHIIHVVATSLPDGSPNPASLAAFVVPPGQGVCMQVHCWHATRVATTEVTCLMLTRRSTTADLVAHLENAQPAQESEIVPVAPFIVERPAD